MMQVSNIYLYVPQIIPQEGAEEISREQWRLQKQSIADWQKCLSEGNPRYPFHQEEWIEVVIQRHTQDVDRMASTVIDWLRKNWKRPFTEHEEQSMLSHIKGLRPQFMSWSEPDAAEFEEYFRIPKNQRLQQRALVKKCINAEFDRYESGYHALAAELEDSAAEGGQGARVERLPIRDFKCVCWFNRVHGIRPSRLSEAAKKELIRFRRCDSLHECEESKQHRVLYHRQDAIAKLSPKFTHRPKRLSSP